MGDVLPWRTEIYARLELLPAVEVGMKLYIPSNRRLKAHLPYLVSNKITAQRAVRHLRVYHDD